MARLIRAKCPVCRWDGPNCRADHAALDAHRCPECQAPVQIRATLRGRLSSLLYVLADRARGRFWQVTWSKAALAVSGVRR